MNPLEKIAAIKNQIGTLPHNVRASYANGMALRNLHKERADAVLFLLGQHQAPEVLHIANSASYTIGILRGEAAQELASTKLVLDLSENSSLFKTAEAQIQPLLAEIAKLEAEIEAAAEIRASKAAALAAAEEQAAEAARQAAENDPAVIACKAALDALDAPSKPKGKVPAEVHEVS